MRRLLPSALVALVLVVGCSKPAVKEPIALDKIPESVMKVARDKLPGVDFNRAMVKSNGSFEILGKDAKGKVREINITPEGVVVEIE